MQGLQKTTKTRCNANCWKQQHDNLHAKFKYATVPKNENKRHGSEVQVKKIMNNDLLLELTRTGLKQHGKNANDNSLTDLAEIHWAWQKQHQVAMFRASKLHATLTYVSKHDHGMIVLNALNKTPLQNLFQIST